MIDANRCARRIRHVLAFVALAVAQATCSDDAATPGGDAGADAGNTGGVSGFAIEFDDASISLVARGTRGKALLVLPAKGFQLGTVDALDDNANYDPYAYATTPAFVAPGLAWQAPKSFKARASGKSGVTVDLTYADGIAARVVIDEAGPGRFDGTWTLDPADAPVAFFRLGATVDASEGLYGLGAYFDDVNQRGKRRAMQLEADPSIESSYNEAHAPVPLLIGTRGWGLFVASRYPGAFDVANDADDWVQASYGTGLASKDGLAFHLFAAAHPLDVIRQYYEVTGYPKLPARWALGPWIWRDENDDQAQVENDVRKIRELDLADTGYWIDRPYSTDVETFDFNPLQFPDPKKMIGLMHDLGFRTALWHAPYLAESSAATQALRDYATAHDFYPLASGLRLNKWGTLLDLTQEDAYAWWQSKLRAYTDLGVEGFKLDYAEDVVVGVGGARISKWKFHDGSDERTMHDGYTLLHHALYSEVLPESGGFLLVRHGTFGDQVNGGIFWPGDEDTGFAAHGEKVTTPDGTSYVAVGGLPATVAYGLNLSASGFPFFGSDTGGYRHTPPTIQCFVRWFEQTALSSVMQVGMSSNTVPWELFDATTDPDGAKLDLYRRYARLHLRLWPYAWTYAQQIAETGRPIQRPLGLAYPELGAHPSDVYLFGDDLLVAPVVEEGATKKTVVFPPGRWVDWWDGSVHKGDKTETVAAPLDTLPLYLREGAIVPMLRPTIDTIAPTTLPKEVDSYATSPGVLYARVVAGETSRFVVFDGTALGQEKTAAGVDLSYKAGSEFEAGALFEAIAFGAAPGEVTIDDAKAPRRASLADLETAADGWAYDAALGGTLYVKLKGGKHVASAR